MGDFYQWRILVGPRYNHFSPWPLIRDEQTGIEFSAGVFTHLEDISSTLSGSVANASVTTLPLTSAANFPTPSGGNVYGAWIYGTAGKFGEYVTYGGKSGNNLTSATREAATAANHGGVHASGEQVRIFYELEDNDGIIRFSPQFDDKLATVTWEGQAQGLKARHWAIRNNHIVIVQYRNVENAVWVNKLLGVIVNPTFRDQGDDTANSRTSQWQFKIYGMDHLWAKQRIAGFRVGMTNLAIASSASGSPGLGLAFDERASGDYIAADPDFGPSSAVDDDIETLWLAERFVGTPINYLAELPEFEAGVGNGNVDRLKFDHIYVNPPPEAPALSKWIQLRYVTSDGDIDNYILYAADGDTLITYEIPKTDLGKAGTIVICESSSVFSELNPASEADLVLENPGMITHLEASGGDLWLRRKGLWLSRVAWGDSSHSGNFPHPDAPGGIYGGGAIPSPGVGETLFYVYDLGYATGVLGISEPTAPAEMWVSGQLKTPGYDLGETPEYVAITLPGMGLHLRDDITSSVPGNSGDLFIVDANGNASTAGLPASGTIRIGSEDIAYANKTADRLILAASGARGANSTVAAAHVEADPVYLRWGSGITDAHMFSAVGWRRHSGSTENPVNFKMWRSPHINPRLPGETDWQNDYFDPDTDFDDNAQPAVVTGYSMGHWDFPFPEGSPQRIKTLVIEISKMTTDPYRPRLNEISATIEPGYYFSGQWKANATTAGNLIKAALMEAGCPEAAITVSGGTATLSEMETASDQCWKIVSDIADFAGCRVTVGNDSHITIAPDPFWTAATPLSSTKTWTEANATSVDKVDRNDILVSQIKIDWRSPDNASRGTEVYPATPGIIGDVVEIDDAVYANGTAAQTAARKRFYIAHYPYTVALESADSEESVAPGQIHSLTWSFNPADGELTRQYLVTGCDHWIEDQHWYTTVYLQQIERILGY